MSPALWPAGRSSEPGAGRLDAPPATWSWAICPPTGAATDTAQPTSSSASAWGTKAVNTRARMPSTVHHRTQLQTPRQLPHLSGRCTQSYSVAHRTAAARSWTRGTCSRRFRPARCGGRGDAPAPHGRRPRPRTPQRPPTGTIGHPQANTPHVALFNSRQPLRAGPDQDTQAPDVRPRRLRTPWRTTPVGVVERRSSTPSWIRARTHAHVPPLNRFSHDFREAIRSVISACFEHFDDLPYSHAPLVRVGAVHPAGCHF